MFVVLFLALGVTHVVSQHSPTTAGGGILFEFSSLKSVVLETMRQVPDRTIVIYTVFTLALWIFRNDFPFNLLILLICSFGAGRLTANVGDRLF
jgi:hypothetical protein